MKKLRLNRWIGCTWPGRRKLLSKPADTQTHLSDARVNSLSYSVQLRSFPAILHMLVGIHTPQCFWIFVIILAAQHPCIGGMLHLMERLYGRQSAEAENANCSLSLPTLLLGLQCVAGARPIQSLTQEQ